MTDNRIRRTNHIEHVMDPHLVDAIEPVPESDRLEQLTLADPTADPSDGPPPAPGASTLVWDPEASGPAGLVDEADWLEQQFPVSATAPDDEDYAPDLGGSR
ncbi:hypothetical protein [Intrasporangium flavum]|uniref:hypothetical protein n=1 Tax=Intrasporangium flavum TaxID=1428657 RepID=UPI00096E948A|nr:hypothetical protein [Intrasporangium flavum]